MIPMKNDEKTLSSKKFNYVKSFNNDKSIRKAQLEYSIKQQQREWSLKQGGLESMNLSKKDRMYLYKKAVDVRLRDHETTKTTFKVKEEALEHSIKLKMMYSGMKADKNMSVKSLSKKSNQINFSKNPIDQNPAEVAQLEVILKREKSHN